MEKIQNEKYDIKRIDRCELWNFSKYDFLDQIQIDDEISKIIEEYEYYDFIDFDIEEYVENNFRVKYEYLDIHFILYEQLVLGFISVYLINNKFLFLKLII